MVESKTSLRVIEGHSVSETAQHEGPVMGVERRLFRPVRSMASGLFLAIDNVTPAPEVTDYCVLLVGFDGESHQVVRDCFRQAGARTTASCRSTSQLADVREMRFRFTHIVVNADAEEGLEVIIDNLLSFRRSTIDIAVLLVSEQVAGDDFGCERDAICDGTLKYPVSVARMNDSFGVMSEKIARRAGTGCDF